nr:MAG TPA: hypothetical protein [Caudoviricetes sp.]
MIYIQPCYHNTLQLNLCQLFFIKMLNKIHFRAIILYKKGRWTA